MFVGIDTAQVNQGISFISDSGELIECINTKSEMPKILHTKTTPDNLKNQYQIEKLNSLLEKYGKPKFVVIEGPSYNSIQTTLVSIGTIHGALQQFLLEKKINYAVVTPLSVNYFIFGTSKNITKIMTINKMKELYKTKLRDSNMADSLAMATLARKFWLFITTDFTLEKHEAEIISSARKQNGRPKGLIFKRDIKVFIFDDIGIKNKEILISRLSEEEENYAKSGKANIRRRNFFRKN